jgi:hypothetical protein
MEGILKAPLLLRGGRRPGWVAAFESLNALNIMVFPLIGFRISGYFVKIGFYVLLSIHFLFFRAFFMQSPTEPAPLE